jgi:hypothetical protein
MNPFKTLGRWLSACLAVVLACADLQPLKRIAAALVQVEEARKELARLQQAEGH